MEVSGIATARKRDYADLMTILKLLFASLVSLRVLSARIHLRALRSAMAAQLCALLLGLGSSSVGCEPSRGEIAGDVRAIAGRTLGARERKPFSSFHAMPWSEMVPGEKGALQALGFDERSWELKVLPETTQRPFEKLTRPQQDAVRAYLPMRLEQEWTSYWQQVRAIAPPPPPQAPAAAPDITREQALEVYAKFVSACKRKDAQALWDLLVDEIHRASERRAAVLRSEPPQVIRSIFGYRRPIESFSGFEYHRLDSLGLDSDPGRDYALCRDVENWTAEVSGPEGREYMLMINRPRNPPLPGSLPFWAMGFFLRRDADGKIRVRSTEWDDRPHEPGTWTTSYFARGEEDSPP